jgi:lysophospholipase L1-like esterase
MNWGSDSSAAPPSLSNTVSGEELEQIMAYDPEAEALDEWNRAVKAYYYHRKEHFESLPDTEGEIIFLGNSITDNAEWWELFENSHVKNRGIGGDDTDGVLERLDEVTSSRPDKIFLMIGTNDLAYLKGVDQVLANYVKILDRIEKETPSTTIYIQSVLPTDDALHTLRKNSDIRRINMALKEMAGERGHTYVDLYTPFADKEGKLNPDYSIDGLHVNGAGYLLWKKLIENYVHE